MSVASMRNGTIRRITALTTDNLEGCNRQAVLGVSPEAIVPALMYVPTRRDVSSGATRGWGNASRVRSARSTRHVRDDCRVAAKDTPRAGQRTPRRGSLGR